MTVCVVGSSYTSTVTNIRSNTSSSVQKLESNRYRPRMAASKRESASTLAACSTPKLSVNLTTQVRLHIARSGYGLGRRRWESHSLALFVPQIPEELHGLWT